MSSAKLDIKSLKYAAGDKEVLLRAPATLQGGRLYILRGASGAGKSTMARVLLGLTSLHHPEVKFSGNVSLSGKSTSDVTIIQNHHYTPDARRHFALIPQLGQQGFVDELSVVDNVGIFTKASASDLAPRVETLAAKMKLWPLPKNMARASGGEKMRLAAVRAFLACEKRSGPQVLIADEPTAGLDSKSAKEVVALLRDFAKDPARVTMVISHDTESVTGILPPEDDEILTNEIVIEEWTLDKALPEKSGIVARFSILIGEHRASKLDCMKDKCLGFADGLGGIVSAPVAFLYGLVTYPPKVLKEQMKGFLQASLAPSTLAFVATTCAFVAITLGIFIFHLLPKPELLEPLILEDLLRAFGVMIVIVILPVIAALFATAKNVSSQTARLASSVRSGLLETLALANIRAEGWALVPLVLSQIASLALATLVALLLGAFAGAMTYVMRGDAMGIVQVLDIMGMGVSAERGWFGWLALRIIGSGFIGASIAAWFGTQPMRSEADVSRAVQRSLVWSLFGVLAYQCALIIAQFLV